MVGADPDGVVPLSDVPVWPDTLAAQWTVDVGGGRSSPIVADGRVFVHSRRATNEAVTATGDVLWQTDYPAPFTQNTFVPPGFQGPFATPLVSAGRLFTFGVTGVLSSWDVETGELIWRHDYSDAIETSGLYGGTSASPLLETGALIIQVGRGRDLLRRQQLTGIVTRESATFAWIRRVHRRNAAGKTRLDGGLLKRCHFGL